MRCLIRGCLHFRFCWGLGGIVLRFNGMMGIDCFFLWGFYGILWDFCGIG